MLLKFRSKYWVGYQYGTSYSDWALIWVRIPPLSGRWQHFSKIVLEIMRQSPYTTTEADFWPTQKQNKYFFPVVLLSSWWISVHYVNGILPYKLAPNRCCTKWQFSNARNSIKNVVWHSFHIVFWSPWADVSFAPINFQNLLLKLLFLLNIAWPVQYTCVYTHTQRVNENNTC